VVRGLRGRDRTGSGRCIALRSHYGFDGFFCIPGRFRRAHLVPVPNVGVLAELNELIAAGDLADDTRVITGRPVTVGIAF